jgi:hypothetical protein
MFFAGLFTKETFLAFIVLFPLAVWFFIKIDYKKDLRTLIYFFLTLTVLIGLFLVIRGLAVAGVPPAQLTVQNNALIGFGFFQRYCLTFYIMMQYLKLLFIPHPLIWDYSLGHFQVAPTVIIFGLISLLLHIALFIMAIIGLKRRFVWSFFILFYLITIAVVSNIFILITSTMGERFLFTPSVAFCVLFIIGLSYLFKMDFRQKRIKARTPFILILLIVGLFFSFETYSRSLDWKDTRTIIAHDYQYSGSLRSKLAYIEIILDDLKQEPFNKDSWDHLRSEIDSILSKYPEKTEKSEIWYTRGIILTMMGDKIRASESYTQAIRLNPHYTDALNNLAVIYYQSGQLDTALDLFLRVIETNPEYSLAYGNIGMIYHQKNNLQMAKKYYEHALKLNTDDAKIKGNYEALKKQLAF